MRIMTKYRCVNDDEFCLCRSCNDNKGNGGTCTHCVTCINGERAMDICDEYKQILSKKGKQL